MQVQETARKAPARARAENRIFDSSFRDLQAGKLRCKTHPALPAFSICSSCGAGVCKECVVAVGGKRYCKLDAERMLRQTRVFRSAAARGSAVTAASVLSYAQGAMASGIGFLFIVLGLLAPSMQQDSSSYSVLAPSFSYFNSVFAFPSVTILVLGGVIFSIGLVDIAAGTMLWRSSKVAGIVAVIAAITASLVGGTFFAVFASVGVLLYVLIALAVANVGTVAAGWSRLK